MDTSYNNYEDEGITPYSEPSTLEPPNTGQVINSNDGTYKTEKLLEDYYQGMINHNHTNFHMIRKIVKEERRDLRASIDLFNKSKLPNLSTNDIFTAKVAGSEIIQRNDKYTS